MLCFLYPLWRGDTHSNVRVMYKGASIVAKAGSQAALRWFFESNRFNEGGKTEEANICLVLAEREFWAFFWKGNSIVFSCPMCYCGEHKLPSRFFLQRQGGVHPKRTLLKDGSLLDFGDLQGLMLPPRSALAFFMIFSSISRPCHL